MRVRVIVNPSAGGGRARRVLPEISSAFDRAGIRCEIAETNAPNHASELARAGRQEGVDVLAAMGGDGTINEVVQAYLDQDGRPATGPDFAIIPFGTGGDFRRSFGWEQNLEESVRRIAAGASRKIDLGAARFKAADAGSGLRAFVNVCSTGISGVVTRAVNRSSKWLGGRLTFYTASFKATLGYANQPMQVTIDGEVVFKGPVYLLALANGRFFGGGMKVAPEADPSDGVLDCTLHGDLSKIAAISLTSGMYDGSHLTRAQARSWRGRNFEISPWLVPAETPIELDGETPGHLPLQVNILPGALTLRV